jgi:uncharacterized protein YndB with AHSA1/START domain
MSDTSVTQFQLQGNQIRIERHFNAPRDLVFAVWTTAEHLKAWWGTREYRTTYCTVDFRVGGRWHYCMTGPNGEESWGIATYQEISAPERFVYTDAFSDAEGNLNPGMPSFSIVVEFIEEAGGTRVISTSFIEREEDVKMLVEIGMEQGSRESWDMLGEYLDSLSR